MINPNYQTSNNNKNALYSQKTSKFSSINFLTFSEIASIQRDNKKLYMSKCNKIPVKYPCTYL